MKYKYLVGGLALAGLLVLSLLLAGCTGIPLLQPAMKGEGITDITPKDSLKPVSFDDAFSAVRSFDPVNKTTFYYIRGDSVDPQGMAKHWIFGIKRGQNQSFYIYTSQGLTSMPWNGKDSYNEIPVATMVRPADLIRNHKVVIQEVQHPDIDEMELVNSVYTLSNTTGPDEKSIRFNAITGNTLP